MMARKPIWSAAFMRRRLAVLRAEQLIDEGACLAALQGGQTGREGVAVGGVQPEPS